MLRDADEPDADRVQRACEAMLDRLDFAESVLTEYARRNGTTVADLSPVMVDAVRSFFIKSDWLDVPPARKRPQPFRRARK